MSEDARWAFLEEPRIAVLAVADNAGRPPLAVPLWVLPDRIHNRISLVTNETDRKLTLMKAAGQITLCVHDDTYPYRYVKVEGHIAIEPASAELRSTLARRYFPAGLADEYTAASLADGVPASAVHMTPRRWNSVDYGT